MKKSSIQFGHWSSHTRAALQALLVTFLWSTSWVLIKLGLQEIPAVLFAGLRYSLAFVCLLPVALHPARRRAFGRLTRADWGRLAGLGVLFYAVTQGAQFIGLAYLPAVTVSMLLNLTNLVVAFLGMLLLAEFPTRLQWLGVLVFIAGAGVYFYPLGFSSGQFAGVLVVLVGVLANAVSSVLGRAVNRDGGVSPLVVTIVSMGVGASLLLAAGLAWQELPSLDWRSWLLIAWLAVVNTAFAFTLWNRSLQQLSAVESSVINGTMLVQVALLAWLFLGEGLSWQQVLGMLLAGLGALLVQLRPI